MPDQPFESLKKNQFIALSTFRKSGIEVITPVWFVNDSERLYIWTGISSGKVKRIKNNPSVRLAPSNMRGEPHGDWIEATATLLDQSEGPAIEKLFRKKYGLQYRIFSGLSQRRGDDHVYLALSGNH